MLRVMRNHARAARGEAEGYEDLEHGAGAARPCFLPRSEAARPRRACLGARHRARPAAWLPQCPSHGDRADRHDRPRHGLRHDRHRARLRAGEIQEARRRRLFQDHQPHGAGGAARSRLSRRGDQAHHRLCRRPRHARRRARRQPRDARRARASPPRRSPRSEKAVATAFDIKFAFNKWTLGEDFLTGHALGCRRSASTSPISTSWRRSASPSARSRPPTNMPAGP